MRIAAVGDVTAFHREPESGYEFAGPAAALPFAPQLDVNANVEFRDSTETEFTMVTGTIP